MAESSSDDFSDIDYAGTKNINQNISDVDSFGAMSPPSNDKKPPQPVSISNAQNKTNAAHQNDASQDGSFASDEFEPDSPPDDDQADDRKQANFNDDENRQHIERLSPNRKDVSPTKTAGNSDALYYNPRDYDSLNVSNEIRRLFEYIERFKYNEIELETQLKPFIPDYIPSIGNVDSFIKPTRSSTNYDKQENEEKLGIQYLDEPILNQSDPSTFYLKLRNESKQVSMNKHAKISYIADAEKNTNKIRNWIDNFKKIKSKSLANNVNIEALNSMPKIEELMQPFMDDKFNEFIKQRQEDGEQIIPSHNIKMSVLDYAKVICNLLEIPVNKDDDINTSLHLLFSTYAALKATANDL
eukprot:CAMPEP_0197034934 /NCGR_PEP_ID=MMETSP1384-20130603/12858_1 /TAXON_ID=29189 /ORGANISM="Ammonia sp." /LENGTH=355 /DNA_ID=CAMNT_0042464907 /DNA_START=31 /DNA_END=1098 /DNA_ORIENTATION=-